MSDLFGLAGRQWLKELELPREERETVDSCMRQIEFLDREVEEVERLIAKDALDSPEMARLMTVPGVNVIVASTFLAAVGDIHRFRSPRRLVGYLGLDPRVRQSGDGPAKQGRISKRGSGPARHALVEASWSVVRQPGPMHAFYQRIRARRGHQVAVVAAARKLACLFWCLLTREEDYAYAHPSPERSCAGSSSPPAHPNARASPASGQPTTRCAPPSASSPTRQSSPTSAPSPTGKPPPHQERARTRHTDAHLKADLTASSAARHQSQTLPFSSSSTAPKTNSCKAGPNQQPGLDFHPSTRPAQTRTRPVLHRSGTEQ